MGDIESRGKIYTRLVELLREQSYLFQEFAHRNRDI